LGTSASVIASCYGKSCRAVAKKFTAVNGASTFEDAQQVTNLFVNLRRISDSARDLCAKQGRRNAAAFDTSDLIVFSGSPTLPAASA